MSDRKLLMYILAVLIPPLAAGLCGGIGSCILNLLLCFLFWIPGVLHAVWVVSGSKE